jgi:hypothetical protein
VTEPARVATRLGYIYSDSRARLYLFAIAISRDYQYQNKVQTRARQLKTYPSYVYYTRASLPSVGRASLSQWGGPTASLTPPLRTARSRRAPHDASAPNALIVGTHRVNDVWHTAFIGRR